MESGAVGLFQQRKGFLAFSMLMMAPRDILLPAALRAA